MVLMRYVCRYISYNTCNDFFLLSIFYAVLYQYSTVVNYYFRYLRRAGHRSHHAQRSNLNRQKPTGRPARLLPPSSFFKNGGRCDGQNWCARTNAQGTAPFILYCHLKLPCWTDTRNCQNVGQKLYSGRSRSDGLKPSYWVVRNAPVYMLVKGFGVKFTCGGAMGITSSKKGRRAIVKKWDDTWVLARNWYVST